MKKMVSVMGLAALALSAMTTSPATAELPKPGSAPQFRAQPGVLFFETVPLQCDGLGASDVSSIHQTIKNTTGHTIPKGIVIHYNTSTKKSGFVKLTADLAPGASFEMWAPGQTNAYTCTAEFFPGDADLAIKKVSWASDGTATIEVANLNWWTDAPKSVMRLQSMKCLSQFVASELVATPAVPKGGSAIVTAKMSRANADYLQVIVNADNAVPETNHANDTAVSPDFGANPSCTPR